MIIGLYDADMSKYIHVPFNLELMKLSSYFKKKNNIATLVTSYEPDKFNTFYYRKDYYDDSFPDDLLTNNKIIYGGYAFSNNYYYPLDEEIEKCAPDTFLYSKMEDTFCTSEKKRQIFNNMMNAAHFRLSLNNKDVWSNFEKQLSEVTNNKIFFLHDYNINQIKDSDYAIKQIIKKKKNDKLPRSLATKFPIVVDNEKDLFKWIDFTSSKFFSSIKYKGIMSDEALVEFINKVKNTSFVKQFEYFITDDNFNEQKFVTKDIIRLYYQIMYLKMKRVFIFLNYDEKKFTNKKWCLLIDFFNCVLNSTSRNINKYINRDNIESLIDFIKEKKFFTITKLKIYFTKNEVRELFNFVRVNNYDLFSEFYDCKKVELKGGSFKSE